MYQRKKKQLPTQKANVTNITTSQPHNLTPLNHPINHEDNPTKYMYLPNPSPDIPYNPRPPHQEPPQTGPITTTPSRIFPSQITFLFFFTPFPSRFHPKSPLT